MSEKRKPGRPRKSPAKEPTQKEGLVNKATDNRNIVEMLYDKPQNFKKICGFWKSLNADKIKFVFTSDKLILYNKNHLETNDVGITCNGLKMNRYYCSNPITICVEFCNLEPILGKLDGIYNTISFIVQEKTKNKTLHVILSNDIKIPEYFEIDIIIDNDVTEEFYDRMFQESVYDIEFKLPGKYLRKMISDTKQFDKQITFEKLGSGNLTFLYKTTNGQVKAKLVPANLTSIALVSNIAPNEIFSVSVFIDNIRPTSTNQLADEIHIKASKNKPLWLWADLDENTIRIDILVKIIDNR